MEWIIIAIVTAGAAWVYAQFEWVTITEMQSGVEYQKGKFVRVVEAGRHLTFKPHTTLVVYDRRPTILTVPGQEVMTKDNIGVKMSVTASYEITDVRTVHESSMGYYGELYSILQIALREVAATKTLDELMDSRDDIGPAVFEKAKDAAVKLGIQLNRVQLLDFMLNANLKRAYAAIKETQKEAEKNLEKARGEAAVLRNLANSAKMLENNPQLVQLRLLQSLSESGNNTIMFNAGNDTAPVAAAPKKKAPPKKK